MVFWHPRDEDMESASQRARDSFKYFWREVTWEFRRIVPGLEMFNVKLPFTDPNDDIPLEDRMTEHMWVQLHDFDGDGLFGELMNQPALRLFIGLDVCHGRAGLRRIFRQSDSGRYECGGSKGAR